MFKHILLLSYEMSSYSYFIFDFRNNLFFIFIFIFSDWYLEWLLAIAFVGGIAAPLNYRWVSKFSVDLIASI